MLDNNATSSECSRLVLQAQFASVLARSDLIMTRKVEWANLLIGFEQVIATTF